MVTIGIASANFHGPYIYRYSAVRPINLRIRTSAKLYLSVNGPPDAEDPAVTIRSVKEPVSHEPFTAALEIVNVVKNIARVHAHRVLLSDRIILGNRACYFEVDELIGYSGITIKCDDHQTLFARSLASPPASAFGHGLETFDLERVDTQFFNAACAEIKGDQRAFDHLALAGLILRQGNPLRPDVRLREAATRLYEERFRAAHLQQTARKRKQQDTEAIEIPDNVPRLGSPFQANRRRTEPDIDVQGVRPSAN